MNNHEILVSLYETYVQERERFLEKGVKVSATRARKALSEIAKVTKELRKEIQEQKTA
jgi:hypothetical protein